MNVLDLFSGIGGFSLGLERAGMRTVAFCERDEYCRAVLRKHWPDVPCFDDIHAIDADGLDRLGRIDLVCGGFPCQPFSVAGEQKGKEDDRHLWPEMCRVIALARPAWVIGENVAGLIAMALDDVLSDLEGLGYTTRTFVIPAASVGAPHRRDRLWIVATNTNGQQHEGRTHAHERKTAAELSAANTNSAELRQQPRRRNGANGEDPLQLGHDGEARYVADASSPRLQGTGDVSGEKSDATAGQSLFRSEDHGRQWSIEPDVGRVAHGVPKRVDRLKSLGNAVVPQVVEEIGRAIMLCA